MKKIVAIICIIMVLCMMNSPVYAATKKDTKAPTVTKTNPVGNTSDIMVESTIVIRFSENIAKGKNFTKITVKELETLNVEYTCEIVDNLLKITPMKDLKYSTLYTVTIPAAALKDKSSNSLKTTFSFDFLTEKDPSKADDSQVKEDTIKYILELEANMEYELTKDNLLYFAGLMEMFGIDATFTDFRKAEEK